MSAARGTSLSERMYAALQRIHPADFRRDYGTEMRELFRDQHREAMARGGRWAVARLWLRALPDLAATGVCEHAAAFHSRTHPSTIARRSSATGGQMHTELAQDLHFAGRMLRKNPVFALVAVAVVALGTGAVSTIFSVANAVVLQPIPGVARASEIVAIDRVRNGGSGSLSASYPFYAHLASNTKTMAGIAAWTMIQLTVSTGGEGTTSLGNIVSGNYFDVLGVRPALGRFFAGEETTVPDSHPVIVISHDFWQRRFAGDSSIVGRTVLVNGMRFTVIGVAPERFSGVYPILRTDAWVPLMMQRELRGGRDLLHDGGAGWLELVGRLGPSASRASARTELAALAAQRASAPESGESTEMRRYSDIRLARASGLPGDVTSPVLAFFVVLLVLSGLVLMIASVNVASMLLARAVARRREIAVRIALGAGRMRLVRQLLTESVVLFIVGGAAGVGLAMFGTRLLARIDLPVDVPLAVHVAPDARVLLATLAIALVTGIVFGLAPALQGSRVDIATSLRGDTSGSGRARSRLRTALVVGQVAMSLLLLTTSGLFVRALDRGRRVDPGFDVTHVATAAINLATSGYDSTRAREQYAALAERVSALPGVTSATYARLLPLSMNTSGTDISIPGYTAPDAHASGSFTVLDDIVDAGYFATLRIPLLSGRDFSRADGPGAPRVAVVNESFATQYLHGAAAVGRSFMIDGTSVTIVGVVRDSKFGKLAERPAPFMYLPLAQHWTSDLNLMVRTTGDASQLAAVLRRELRALDATLPAPTMTTLQQSTAVALLPQRVAVAVTGALGVAGLLLAVIGLYGVISFSTAQRTREIGIRVALGAARRDVLGLVVGEGMTLVGAGMAIGLVLAALATRLLTPFLFGVSPLDALTFVAIGAMLAGAALLASYLPARRAAGVDPVLALRQE